MIDFSVFPLKLLNIKQLITPSVTIVILIYKVEEFVEKCFQSVINQTYKNIECILVNDVLWSFQSMLKFEKIAFLREDTYLYYFHGASIIHNRGEKHFGNWITIAGYMDKAYREEKDGYTKKQILQYLVEFKAMTLEMNWKAQKNEQLWKKSYTAYKRMTSLSISDYMSSGYSSKLKKQDLFYRLPLFIGYPFFRWRFDR
ncbi:glycosyltransferase [Epilithonimonas sp.]|uniref:glycosyltransferase n=1 Tax=Epilithonimonas sp. TaxID=2894511 RepID=UPI0035B3FBFF